MHIVVREGIKLQTVKRDPLYADRDFRQKWPDFAAKTVFVHAQERRFVLIGRRCYPGSRRA